MRTIERYKVLISSNGKTHWLKLIRVKFFSLSPRQDAFFSWFLIIQVSAFFATPYIVLSILNLFKTKHDISTKVSLRSLRILATGSNIFPESSLGYLRECLPDLMSFGNGKHTFNASLTRNVARPAFIHEVYNKPCFFLPSSSVWSNGDHRRLRSFLQRILQT